MKTIVLGRRGVADGDVLIERGPVLGVRYWRVVCVDAKRKHDHARCIPTTHHEIAPDDHLWELVRA